MRCVLLMCGGGDVEKAKNECLEHAMIVILNVIDQNIMSGLPPTVFTEIVNESETKAEEIEEEFRRIGKMVKVDTVWGPVKEKLRNAMKMWDADEGLVLVSGSRFSEQLKEEIGRMKKVRFV